MTLAWNNVGENHSQNILTKEQLKEYDGFKNVGRKQEYLATRWLVKNMVDYMNLDASRFLLRKDNYGKPSGHYGGEEYKISIAHTDLHVLCAISKHRELGVDMEPVGRKVPDILRDRMINATEKKLLQQEDTIRIWTVKEAMVKLEGKGMRTNLNECTLKEFAKDQFVATFNNDNKAKIRSFTHQNHWLAIAWND